jgi:hypothetical protein
MLFVVASDEGLTAAQVQQFIEEGFVWLRGCIEPRLARSIVARVFAPNGGPRHCTRRTAEGQSAFEYTGQPLSDCREWSTVRVDVDTGFETQIARLSPRLHRVIEQLTAPGAVPHASIGRQWILNVEHHPEVPDARAREERYRKVYWHIDTPTPRTTLVGRFDALTLLILWSDVEEHGGGTLYAPDSLDRVVEVLATTMQGVDTRAHAFGSSIMERCVDVRAQIGRAGDVLVTHPFVLHASTENYRLPVRILENRVLYVSRELDYRRTNPAPSAVEACVIRRLPALPAAGPLMVYEVERAHADDARSRLIEEFPSHFFPYAGAANRRDDLGWVDRFVFEWWVAHKARAIAFHLPDTVGAARSVVALVRSLLVTSHQLAGVHVRDALDEASSLAARAYACLVLGFTNNEGVSYVVGRLLRAMGYEVYAYRAATGGTHDRHTLILLRSEGAGAFIDAASMVPVSWLEGFDMRHACRRWVGPVPELEGPMRGLPSHPHPRGSNGGPLLRGELLPCDLLDASDPGRARAAVESFRQGERRPVAAAAEAWRAFLRVRVEHLEDTLTRPNEAYAALLENPGLEGKTRELVSILGRIANNRFESDRLDRRR